MENKSLEKLEFNIVKENLSQHAITFLGKNKCLNLLPLNSQNDIEKALHQTTEASILILRKGNISINNFVDITEYLKHLSSSSTLSISGILSLYNILKISRELKKYFNSEEIDMSYFKNLENIFRNLYTNVSIEEKINSVIIDDNTISDNASSNLNNIRKQIKSKEAEIKNKLNNFLHTKYVQESIITKRNNRFVIPIKSEYQAEVKGFVHDTSSSGSTIFIEPLSVFELNNSITSLKNEENIEIEKILQKLSSLFFDIIYEIENNYNLIGIIDFIFAKAKYSISLGATEPIISNEKKIKLIDAYHPLIEKNIAVKNSIYLGKDFNTLIITGPNTGGKTVTLKTVGLLCLMAKSGLHITAKENSLVYIFDNIYADIGDEQNISDSLSTFSSHMSNISKILKKATSESLVLLDELGSGTDPIEGENLAISILNFLYSRNILTLATTHYSKLKNFALITDGFENASVEFNINTMSPTYKLLLGVPGRSNAFEISKKLGIPEEIVSYARNLMDNDDIEIEDLLKSIYENKRIIETEKENILFNSNKARDLKESLETEYNNLKNKESEILNKAKESAKNILLEAKEDANNLIRNLENTSDTKKANKIRDSLNKKISEININDEVISLKNINNIPREKIKINTTVYINSIKQNGVVISNISKDNKVKIQVGVIKTFFDINDLSYPIKTEKQNINTTSHKEFSVKQISSEINVIGKNIDEACFIIDKYLDTCFLNGLMTVRIVHGKGTGALRNGIHKYLKTHPHVKDFRIGTFGEGEMGATIVNLK
ncbi:MAG: endonuclease MutS2 [Candidatus Scatovivens sp.]